jgi:hypothetical protein
LEAAEESAGVMRQPEEEEELEVQAQSEPEEEEEEPIQAKSELTVGAPGDRYEREADAVADRVMAMPEPGVQRQELEEEEPPEVQAQVEEEEEEPVRAKGESVPTVTPAMKSELDASRGAGAPLPRDVRAFMEPRFGREFSGVRVHTGSRAVSLAKGLRAQAFTRGSDIYFASGKYAPATAAGKRLVAHELAHIIHQGGGRLPTTGRPKFRSPPVTSPKISPNCIQKAEGVDPPIVTQENPLVRILRGQTPGITYPYVNKINIVNSTALDNALPSRLPYRVWMYIWHKKRFVRTCKVSRPIDVKSQAKIITASKPGPKGWEVKVPFSTVKRVLGIKNRSCARKKGNIKVRLVAAVGNVKYAAMVRNAEKDHERVLEKIHKSYLKKYHDYVNNELGTGLQLRRCAYNLAVKLRRKEIWAINKWVKDWAESNKKFDGPGGSHRDVATSKVIGNCSEVLVVIRRGSAIKAFIESSGERMRQRIIKSAEDI